MAIPVTNKIKKNMRHKKIFLILALLCAVVQGTWAQVPNPWVYDDVWDGVTKTEPVLYASFGGRSKVIVINTAAELAYIAEHWGDEPSKSYEVTGFHTSYYEHDYYLNANIDMGDKVPWTPLGYNERIIGGKKFIGEFFGNCHTIRIHISGNLSDNGQGFFHDITANAKVRDLHVTGKIKVGNVRQVGGIAGESLGKIVDCWVSADVSSTHYHFITCAQLGGIVGINEHVSESHEVYGVDGGKEEWGSSSYCCMTGNVSNPENYAVGGIAGETVDNAEHLTFYGTRTNSYKQDNIWVGKRNNATLTETHSDDLCDDATLEAYLNRFSGNDLYRYAVKYPYGIIFSTTGGSGAFVANAGGESNVPGTRPGKTVTLTVASGKPRKIVITDADGNNVPYSGNETDGFTFTMPRRNVTVSAIFLLDWPKQGSGTEDDPYLITSEKDWNDFCTNVSYGEPYSGKVIKLTNDISVTTMAGTNINDTFQGIFDGGGHKMSVNYNTETQATAPFSYVKDATFRNLHVDGTITASESRAGGIVGISFGSLNITNCRSSVTITGKQKTLDNGGFVGSLSGEENKVIDGCVFDGSFIDNGLAREYNGFVGTVRGQTPHISNSLMKPVRVDTNASGSILDNTFTIVAYDAEPNITHCYFVETPNLPGNQGTQSRNITAGENVTLTVSPVGNSTATYDVSGITVYESGIVCDGKFYYGNGDKVSLTVKDPGIAPEPGYKYLYDAVYTIGGSVKTEKLPFENNQYTFTMPDTDVTISFNPSTPASIDWALVSQGTAEDPYRIYFKEQLDLLAERMKSNDYSGTGAFYRDKYFKLMNDIVYPHETAWDDATSTENNFTTIGGSFDGTYPEFSGNFDGNGHTISGIRIYSSSACGLFGRTHNANIHNLTLADTRITAELNFGGIVGIKEGGTVTNCHVTSTVAIHSVVEGPKFIGGIVGDNDYGTISHCTSAATITIVHSGDSRGCGGIAGYNSGTLSDNFVIGATIPAMTYDNYGTIVHQYGAVCGINGSSGTMQRNYYTGCNVAGTANATGVGCSTADVTTDNGAVAAYSITSGDAAISVANGGTVSYKDDAIELTAYATGFAYNGVLYAASGDAVSLTLSHNREDMKATYKASAGTLTSTEQGHTLTMPAQDVTISAASWIPDAFEGEGTAAKPYLISSAEQWDKIANYVSAGIVNGFKDKHLKLTNDIAVTTMVGSDGNHTFRGTFDGAGHTLTVNYTTDEQYAAPFHYTYGATIKNLHTAGTINTSNSHAGGVVGRNGSQSTALENVSSSATINSTFNGSAYHGGLMGYAINASFTGCVFTGSLLGSDSHHCGGLLGQKSVTGGSNATLTGCLFNPAEITVGTDRSFTFAAAAHQLTSISNSYYTKLLGDVQGTESSGRTTAPANIGSLVKDYGTLKTYANGILYDGKYYVAPSDISLADNGNHTSAISAADGYLANVTLTGRTLYLDGKWNTLYLPFDYDISTFSGIEARMLTAASIEGTTLNLTFSNPVTMLEAGVPYIFKAAKEEDYVDDDAHNLLNPMFFDVTIDATDCSYDNHASGDARVRFIGTYSSTTFTAADNSILLMGGENTLYYPAAGAGIGSCRAYFKIGEDGAAAPRIDGFSIDFGNDSNATGILTTNFTNPTNSDNEWYTLDGRKLVGKPTQHGIYINNGKKVVNK